jgi:hypothetical protein
MTKVRAPLTFDNALSRIAGMIGWGAMGEAVGQAERTVRDWGDPDTGRSCPIDAAVKLDLAFQEAGGKGAPMHETFSLLLDQSKAERFADQVELAHHHCTIIKEAAEAGQALILATLPGATRVERATALREVEENIVALKATVPFLSEDPAS